MRGHMWRGHTWGGDIQGAYRREAKVREQNGE